MIDLQNDVEKKINRFKLQNFEEFTISKAYLKLSIVINEQMD